MNGWQRTGALTSLSHAILIHVCPHPVLGLPPHLPDFRGAVGMRRRDAERLSDRTVVI